MNTVIVHREGEGRDARPDREAVEEAALDEVVRILIDAAAIAGVTPEALVADSSDAALANLYGQCVVDLNGAVNAHSRDRQCMYIFHRDESMCPWGPSSHGIRAPRMTDFT